MSPKQTRSSTESPAIEVRGLTKQYSDIVAIDGVDLTVDCGEVFGFLGPNGAGKSTTINILLDLARPTDGNVSVLGHDPRSESATVRGRTGVLAEGYGLYDRLTARKHLSLAINLEESDDRPDELLSRVGLADAADRPAGEFSKGMRQRLALAMALVDDPDLLILDEPSAGLDPNGVRTLRQIIREEADRGTAVFFSSHVLEQVEAVCDRVGIMNEGRLVAVDTVDGLRDSLGAGSTLLLEVDTLPEALSLADINGVESVTVEGATLRVDCSTTDVKSTVISHVEDAGSTVTDITSEETGMEDLFAAYAGGDTQ